MRAFLIRNVLPGLLCLLPVAGGVLVVSAAPRLALDFYLGSIRTSYLDWLILALGGGFFLIQLLLAFRALRWQEQAFDQRPDPWIQRFYQAAEWFPLLGLFGTVAGILQTFGAVGASGSLQQREIIHLYAPALTTTASGLLMALLNIVPLWMVAVGRGLIVSLSADPALTREP